MSALSNVFENALADFLYRGQALSVAGATAAAGSGPTSYYFGLVTAVGDDTGGYTEVTGGGYARVQVASTLANWSGTQGAGTTVVSSGTSGTISNNNAITFPQPTGADWGRITGVILMSALTGGVEVQYAALTTAKNVSDGDSPPYFPAGFFQIQVDN